MKRFFHDYSYSIVKMFVNQFAIAIFGIALFTPTFNNMPTLNLITSIFAVIFYLFLIYVLTWEIGAKDRISVDVGKKPYRPHTGLLLSLVANVPNLLLAVFCWVTAAINPAKQFWAIPTLLNGMYWGIIRNVKLPFGVGGSWVPISEFWLTFYIIVVPALITCWIAYFMGFKNIRIIAKPPKAPAEKPNIKK